MTIRSDAIRWLASRGVTGGHTVTSKRYAPEESWTRATAWWVQIPAAAVRRGAVIHIVCQAGPGTQHFRYLRVPSSFFQEHLEDFATIGDDKINLFLAAETGIEFKDQRGPGRLSFAHFEQQ